MHIVLDARMIDSGGIGTYLKNLIMQLKEYPLRLELLLSKELLIKHHFLKDFDYKIINAPIYSIKEQYILPKIIPDCDLFWSPHFNVPLFPIKARKRLVTIHDVYHLAWASSLSFLERAYAKKLIKSAAKRSELIITGSHFSANEIRHYTGTDPKKIQVIYHGTDHFYFSNPCKQGIHAKFKLPKRYFLFVGNLKPHKNLQNLLIAFRKVIKQDPEIYLVMVGKKKGFIHGENFEKIMKEDPNLSNRVDFLDDVDDQDLPAIYASAMGLIFPSFYEGFGLPPLEAMRAGCPVIASFIPPIREICNDSALYINPYSADSIYHGIMQLMKDEILKQSLVLKGMTYVADFTWSKSAQRHYELLQGIVGNSAV